MKKTTLNLFYGVVTGITLILLLLTIAASFKNNINLFGFAKFWMIFLPLAGFALYLNIKRNDIDETKEEQLSTGMKKCPYCAEMIKGEATVCRYCGKDVPAAPKPTIKRKNVFHSNKKNSNLKSYPGKKD